MAVLSVWKLNISRVFHISRKLSQTLSLRRISLKIKPPPDLLIRDCFIVIIMFLVFDSHREILGDILAVAAY